MAQPSYALARTTAPTIHSYLEDSRKPAREQGEADIAPLPDEEVIEAIVEATFWASLRREEGRSPTISLAYLSPHHAKDPLHFDRRLPLAPGALIRLAPAVERPGIHLGVWHENDDLYVWGATRSLPNLCFVLEVVEPGVLVNKYSRGEGRGKFGNIAVLRGDRVEVIDEGMAEEPECPGLLASLLGTSPREPRLDNCNVLVQLAISMRTHGHGGSLLIVPSSSGAWKESIVWPIPYRIEPAFDRLANLVRQGVPPDDGHLWRQDLQRTVEGIAGLTAVDGAMILSTSYEVLAFGARIKRMKGAAAVQEVMATEPIMGKTASVVDPGQIGATRHLSAAQFAHDQHDALALVASQDGRFTIFAWSEADQLVRAHRIDTLLL